MKTKIFLRQYILLVGALLVATTTLVAQTNTPIPQEAQNVLEQEGGEDELQQVAEKSTTTTISPDVLWERGNRLYAAGDYNGAFAAYDSICEAGWQSGKLFYNMGNACFKSGNLGEAILYYNKAHKFMPSDDDVAYNLAYANSFVKDKIDVVPQFFLSAWLDRVRNVMSSDSWAVLSLALLALTLAAGLVYFLGMRRRVRKAGFVFALVAAFFTILTLSFAAVERKDILDCSEGVVVSSAAAVKSSPDRASKDIFILHEGTKVVLLDTFGAWSEIRIADGNEGWIASSSVSVID